MLVLIIKFDDPPLGPPGKRGAQGHEGSKGVPGSPGKYFKILFFLKITIRGHVENKLTILNFRGKSQKHKSDLFTTYKIELITK